MNEDNIFHRTCNQLHDFLVENGIRVDSVSRCHIGAKNFYHLEFNIPDGDYTLEVSEKIGGIDSLLNIVNLGLADFYQYRKSGQGTMIHEVVLIDEDELNKKYLRDGDLIFSKEGAK